MDFGFTPEQEEFRRAVRDFVTKELAAGAPERAELEYLPKGMIKRVGEGGLIGVNLPVEYGGHPSDWMSLGIACEELTKVDVYLTNPLVMTVGAYLALRSATEELRQEWLPDLIGGNKTLCLANTEPNCGADAAALRTRAVREGDHYVISGEKTSITRGAHADVAMLWAKTDPQAGARGVTCFLVPLDLPGITKRVLPHAGYKPLAAASLIFDEVRIPARYRVGEEGRGFYIVMGNFDLFRVLLSLNTLTSAQLALDETIAYAKQHTAFGRPIAKYQGISLKLAECATLIDAGKFLAYRALWLKDQGQPHSKESAMSKWYSTETASRIIRDLMLIQGRVGYAVEGGMVRRFMEAVGMEIVEGPAQIQKMIIARELLGRESA